MRQAIRFTIAGAMAIVALALTLGAVRASAQIGWNPPCNTMTINNPTACTARFTLITMPGFLPNPIIVPAGGAVVFPPPGPFPNPLTVNGVVSLGGNFYPVFPGGPIMPPPAPPVAPCGWIPNVLLGPAPGCCFDIFFDCRPGFCAIWLVPSAAPPPCRP